MAVRVPNGSLVYMASGYGAVKTMTALTNASEGVATLEASHGVVEGDFIDKIVRAGTVSTNDVDLEGINTTSTTIYPAGSGTGSVREISGWTQITQILSSSSTGGEQQFLEYQFLEADAQVRIPTVKSPGGLTFTIGDDPTLAGYIAVETANDDRLKRAFRIILPSGAIILYNAYVSLNKTPSLTVNEIMACEVTLSFLNEPVRYSA
jgi:hypothetical protein